MQKFYELLKIQNEKQTQSPPMPRADLAPPAVILESLEQLKSIMKEYETSFVDDAEHYDGVLKALVVREAERDAMMRCERLRLRLKSLDSLLLLLFYFLTTLSWILI